MPPSVAIEIASGRVTVAEVGRGGGGTAVTGYASEALPREAVVPAPSGANIPAPDVVAAAVRQAFGRAGIRSVSRAALVVPDSVARVSLLHFEQLPTKASDLDQ